MADIIKTGWIWSVDIQSRWEHPGWTMPEGEGSVSFLRKERWSFIVWIKVNLWLNNGSTDTSMYEVYVQCGGVWLGS